ITAKSIDATNVCEVTTWFSSIDGDAEVTLALNESITIQYDENSLFRIIGKVV
ncbi:unnamed protein product, partial [marine sediment metagenome]